MLKHYAKLFNEPESEVVWRVLDTYDTALAEQEDELQVLAEVLKESTARTDKAVTSAIKDAGPIQNG